MVVSPREEALRKGIHTLLSLVAAAVVAFLPPLHAATILAAATTAALAVEVARRVRGPVAELFRHWLRPLLREAESHRLTGATTLSIGYTLVAVVLPGWPALAGILVAGVADAIAAVVGKRFGRRHYPGGKTVEGSVAFFASVLPLALIVPGVGWIGGLGLALALTLIEAPTLPIDDNLYLPIAAGAAVQGVLLLPALTFFS